MGMPGILGTATCRAVHTDYFTYFLTLPWMWTSIVASSAPPFPEAQDK